MSSTPFRLDHVAVALRAIDPALRLFRDALGGTETGRGDGDTWRWRQVAYPGGGRVELLEPRGPGFLTRFLDARGEGLHHLTYLTDDLRASAAHVGDLGYELVDADLEHPHWKQAFVRPSSAHGTLIQLAQHTPHG